MSVRVFARVIHQMINRLASKAACWMLCPVAASRAEGQDCQTLSVSGGETRSIFSIVNHRRHSHPCRPASEEKGRNVTYPDSSGYISSPLAGGLSALWGSHEQGEVTAMASLGPRTERRKQSDEQKEEEEKGGD